MNSVDTNGLLVFNSIIYDIHAIKECNHMRKVLFEKLHMVIEFDAGCFYLMSADEQNRFCDPVAYLYDAQEQSSPEQLGLLCDMLNAEKSIAYRETDYIPDEERMQKAYYNKLYQPNHWHYALHIIFNYNKEALGCLNLYKTIGSSNFSLNDIDICNLLKDHIALRLYHYKKERLLEGEKLSIEEAVLRYNLTQKEHQIVRRLLKGLDNKDICTELKITANTLKKHIVNIYRKLDINNRTQLFKQIKEFP